MLAITILTSCNSKEKEDKAFARVSTSNNPQEMRAYLDNYFEEASPEHLVKIRKNLRVWVDDSTAYANICKTKDLATKISLENEYMEKFKDGGNHKTEISNMLAKDQKAKEELELKEQKAQKEEKKEEKKDSTANKKSEKLKLDLDNIAERTFRLTKFSGRLGDHYLTEDGSKLFYQVRLENSYDLCMMDMAEGNVKVIKRRCIGQLVPSKDGKTIYYNAGQGTVTSTVSSSSLVSRAAASSFLRVSSMALSSSARIWFAS